VPNETSRLTLQEPLISDSTSELRLSITANAQTLDNAVLVTEGTLVERPTASSVEKDHIFRATDVDEWYITDGTTWQILAPSPPSVGASVIATAQSTSSTSYTTLATPDEISGLVIPTYGLIRVWYNATWQESVASAARAAIFIGANQIKVPFSQSAGGPVTEAALTGSASPINTNYALASCSIGLVGSSQAAYSGDVTTGQAQGIATAFSGIELGGVVTEEGLSDAIAFGGPCDIDNLPGGTYTISVQFKTSSGSVTVSNRRLRAQVIAFS
jgi:hypothetical protein